MENYHIYSFAIEPETYQPSGYTNFSCINMVDMLRISLQLRDYHAAKQMIENGHQYEHLLDEFPILEQLTFELNSENIKGNQ